MTKVLLAVDVDFMFKFIDPVFVSTELLKKCQADAQKMVEEAIKETEQRAKCEVLDEVLSLYNITIHQSGVWLRMADIEQIRQKYKGVE